MYHTVTTSFLFKSFVHFLLILCIPAAAAIPLFEGSDVFGDIQEPLSTSLELPLRVSSPMTIGLSFHWPSKSKDDPSSHTTYVELPVNRKVIQSSDISSAYLLRTTEQVPLSLSQQPAPDSPIGVLSSRAEALQEDLEDKRRLSSSNTLSDNLNSDDENHLIWRNNPLRQPGPRTFGKRDLQETESSTELREQTGLPLHPHLVRIYKIVYSPTAWNTYSVPSSIASTITCHAYPKLSAEEKSSLNRGKWSLFGGGPQMSEDRISWNIDDGEVDFEDRFGRWFLQGREVEEWECRDW